MSALLTHAAVGVLLGLALRWPAKALPIAALLAMLPDVDHLPIPLMESRVTLHNVLFCTALPLASAFAIRARRGSPGLVAISFGTPLLLTSHLILDLLPLDPPGSVGHAALFFPLVHEQYYPPLWRSDYRIPLSVTQSGAALLLLGAATVATSFALSVAGRRGQWGWLGGYAAAALVVFPALAAGGTIYSAPGYRPALVEIDDAVVTNAVLHLVVHHVTGSSVPGLSIRVISEDGRTLTERSLGATLLPGDSRTVDVDLPSEGPVIVELMSKDGHVYDEVQIPTQAIR